VRSVGYTRGIDKDFIETEDDICRSHATADGDVVGLPPLQCRHSSVLETTHNITHVMTTASHEVYFCMSGRASTNDLNLFRGHGEMHTNGKATAVVDAEKRL